MEDIKFLKEVKQVLEKGLEEMGKKGSFIAINMIDNRIEGLKKKIEEHENKTLDNKNV